MISLDIDTETFERWQKHAVACGISVEDWLRQKLDNEQDLGAPRGMRMSSNEWSEWLRKFAKRHPPTGHPMDDSRESIYD